MIEQQEDPKPHKIKFIAKSKEDKVPACGYDVNLEIDGKQVTATYFSLEAEPGNKHITATVKLLVSEVLIETDTELVQKDVTSIIDNSPKYTDSTKPYLPFDEGNYKKNL